MRTPSCLRLVAFLAAAAALLALPGCMSEAGSEAIQGGTDTETLTGLMLTARGERAAGVRVKLIPSTYDPRRPDTSLIRAAVTDRDGRYTFQKAKAAGSYNLLAAGTAGSALFREDLPSDSVPDTLRLEPSRKFYISMYGDYYDYSPGRVWFPGTDILVRCEADSAMIMDGLPRRMNDMVLESEAGWRHDITIKVPGDTLLIFADRSEVHCIPF